MDQVVHRSLRFDRFTLELTRGCLRAGDEDIELRPKPFEVLRYLAENAGRLVPKDELIAAVWRDVAVTDDSLVQCIRELRVKLGDDQHRLIKTVSRRGYMLDAEVTRSAPRSASAGLVVSPSEGPVSLTPGFGGRVLPQVTPHRWLPWGAAVAGLAILMLGATYLTSVPLAPMAGLGQRLSGLAGRSSSPVPPRPTFKDCDACPEMVELPVGEFMMGAPEQERRFEGTEGPQRRVQVAQRFAIGRFEVTIEQFAAFVAETGYEAGARCGCSSPTTDLRSGHL